MLLLIYCLMFFPLFVGVLCLSLFCYALLCVHSSFFNHFKEEDKSVCFAIFVLQIYSDYKFSVTHGAVGLSAVCNCGIS